MSENFKRKSSKKTSSFKKKSKKAKTDECIPLPLNDEVDNRFGTDLTESEISEQFEIFLDDMEIPADKKKFLREKDIKIKLTMMSRSKTIIIPKPGHYVNLLKLIINNQSSTIIPDLESVWISLNSYKVSWLKQFYEPPNNGLDFLIDAFKALNRKPEAEFVCLKCFRAFGNCGFGLFKLIEHKQALLCIASCLRPEHSSLMLLAVEILTIFAFYSTKSHANVLDALNGAAALNKYESRFEPLIKGSEVHLSEEHESLSFACVRFINVLINPNFQEKDNEPLKLYYCLHLRREFINFGLIKVFDKLKQRENIPDTLKLIKKFMDEYETERAENLEEAETLIDDFGDCEEIFRQLKSSVANTAAEISLQSILGTLLIIKDDPLRNKIYTFIEKINTEIILQNDDAFCPDPTLRTFNEINLKKMITTTITAENETLREKLARQKLAFEEQKMQFIAYKTNNPCKSEPKSENSFNKFRDGIHNSNSSVLGLVKKHQNQ